MNNLKDLLMNHALIVPMVAWISAQVIKLLLTLIFTKKVVLERLFGAGGMPSAHSALVCALVISVARTEGISSPLFAISFIFAGIVMYDAMGVRRAAGEQAKVINKMLDIWRKNAEITESEDRVDIPISLEDDDLDQMKELKEFLGHTPLEVLGGALLGILVAMFFPA